MSRLQCFYTAIIVLSTIKSNHHALTQIPIFRHFQQLDLFIQISCLSSFQIHKFRSLQSQFSDLSHTGSFQISPIKIFRSFPYWLNQFFIVLPLFSLQYLSISQTVYFSTLSIKHHINNCVNCVNLIPLSLFFPLSLSLSIYLCEISLSLSFHILHLRYNSLTMHCLLHTLILLKNSVSSNQQTSN